VSRFRDLWRPTVFSVCIWSTCLLTSLLHSNSVNSQNLEISKLNLLWKEVLQSPSNPEKNIEYGLEAERSGFYDRAASAYIRAIKHDPSNKLAKFRLETLAKIQRPNKTTGTLITSSTYNANSSQTRYNAKGDTALSKTLLITDNRTLLNTRWRSVFVNYADLHSTLRNSDVIFTSVNSGPIFYFEEKQSANFSLIFENTVIDKKVDNFSFGINSVYDFNRVDIKYLKLSLKYNKGQSEGSINYLNTFFSSSIGVANSVLFKKDHINFEPSVNINVNRSGYDSAGERDRLIESGANFNYSVSLDSTQTFDFSNSFQYTHYFKNKKTDSKNRSDFLYNVGITYNIRPIEFISFSLSFAYERNFSNFNENHYSNSTIGSSVILSF